MKQKVFIFLLFIGFVIAANYNVAYSEEMDVNSHYIKGNLGASLSIDTEITFSDQNGIHETIENKDIGTAYLLELGFGRDFGKLFRGEALLSYRTGYEVDAWSNEAAINFVRYEADISSFSLFFNGYADFYNKEFKSFKLSPYIGGGIGLALNSADDFSAKFANGAIVTWEGKTTTCFVWNLMVGVGFDLKNGFIIDTGYRYADLGDIESGDNILSGAIGTLRQPAKGDLTAHELYLGIRYYF